MIQLADESTKIIYESFKMGRETALEALILELEEIKANVYPSKLITYDKIIDYVKSKLDDGYRDNYGIAMESSYNGDKSCVAFGTKDSNDVIKIRTFFMNEQPGGSMKKSDTSEALKRVVDTLDSKCNQYRRDPIDVISTNELITQLKIKVIRAQLTSDKAKQEDELLDVAVYAILTLDKFLKNK